jgi:hypothetical protein
MSIYGTNQVLTNFYNDVKDRIRLFEYEEDALVQLTACEKKAFVGSSEELEDFLKLIRNRVGLGRGKEKFLSHALYWQIPAAAGGFIHRRMSQLISSGIYYIWEEAYYAKTRDELDPSLKKTIETKQSLDTKLGALFKIIFLELSLCISVFCFEVLLSKIGCISSALFWVLTIMCAANAHIRLTFTGTCCSLWNVFIRSFVSKNLNRILGL